MCSCVKSYEEPVEFVCKFSLVDEIIKRTRSDLYYKIRKPEHVKDDSEMGSRLANAYDTETAEEWTILHELGAARNWMASLIYSNPKTDQPVSDAQYLRSIQMRVDTVWGGRAVTREWMEDMRKRDVIDGLYKRAYKEAVRLRTELLEYKGDLFVKLPNLPAVPAFDNNNGEKNSQQKMTDMFWKEDKFSRKARLRNKKCFT